MATKTAPKTAPKTEPKTATLTRRKFLTGTTVGVAGAATVGVVVGALGDTTVRNIAQSSTEATATTQLSNPLMVYVTDASKGEVTFLLGSHEVVRHDPALVARLVKAMG